MSNSVARSTAAGTTVTTKLAKTQSQPKIGGCQAEQEQHQSQQQLSKVSIAPSASRSPTTKTPPVRLTRSISSKPNVEANRRTIPKTKIHKELIKAKVKSNPALLHKDGSPSRSSKEEGQPRRFAKRGEL